MSAKQPEKPEQSREFCVVEDDGTVTDRALHAGILLDPEFEDETDDEPEQPEEPGPGENEADEEDLSDLDEIEKLVDDAG